METEDNSLTLLVLKLKLTVRKTQKLTLHFFFLVQHVFSLLTSRVKISSCQWIYLFIYSLQWFGLSQSPNLVQSPNLAQSQVLNHLVQGEKDQQEKYQEDKVLVEGQLNMYCNSRNNNLFGQFDAHFTANSCF